MARPHASALRRLAAAACVLGSCAGPTRAPTAPPGAGVAITISPLTLAEISRAVYTLTIVNAGGDTVVTRELDSQVYGAPGGSLSYVAPCDADRNDNVVTVTVDALYSGPAGATLVPADAWVDPGSITRTVTCLADADVSVTFDITVMRAAQQGFFDIAVDLEDVFCSAKLDCDTTHAFPGFATDTTVVLALVCTAGPDTATTLYLDDLDVTCGAATASVDPAAGPGQLAVGAGISGAVGIIDAAAVYRGQEQLSGAARYWNVALALADGAASCTLHTQGTVSPTPLAGYTTAADAVYPYIDWTVPLTDAGGVPVCAAHPLGGTGAAAGVSIGYTTSGPLTFDHEHPLAGAPPPAFAASLVAAWPGDFTAEDTVGASDGALQGTATFAAGRACGAFSFDGAGDVAVATPPLLAGAVSIEAWVRRAAVAPTETIEAIAGRWGSVATGTGSYVISLRQGPNGIYPELEISTSGSNYVIAADTAYVIPNATWAYVAGTFDGQTARLYVDGALVASTPLVGTLASPAASPFTIGAIRDTTTRAWFRGLVSDVRVYSDALTDAEILANYQAGLALPAACPGVDPSAGLVAYWPADGDPLDAVGASDATPVGSVSYVSSPWCQAWDFPSSPVTYLTLGDAPAVSLTSEITVSAWVRFVGPGPATASNLYISLLSNWDEISNGGAGYSLALTPADATHYRPAFSVSSTGFDSHGAGTATTLVNGVWTHVVGVYDGAEVVLYVDGVRVGSSPFVGSVYDPPGVTIEINAIVRAAGTVHSMVGQIDEMRVFDLGLDAATVAALHTSELAGRSCP